MKNSLLVLLLYLGLGVNSFADYEALKAYKVKIKNQNMVQKASLYKAPVEYFVIDFNDINKMNTYSLEIKYGLQLHQCIADGICIFKFKNFQKNYLNTDEIIDKESNIKKIKEYKTYDFKAF